MIFLILFIAGGLVVPVVLDSAQHPGDNIFRRSGRDLLNYEVTLSALRFLRLSGEKLNAGVVGVVALVSTLAILKLVWSLLRILLSLIGF